MDQFKLNKENQRPRFLNLWQISLPLTGFVSIFHRISGILLFLSFPFLLYLLQRSLSGPEGFAEVLVSMGSWPVRLLMLLLLWLFAHHLFAGIRFLMLDMDWGTDLVTARRTAAGVVTAALVVLLAGVVL